MEYCDGGDLHNRISAQNKLNTPFDEKQIIIWLRQICLAIQVTLHLKASYLNNFTNVTKIQN